MRVVLLLQLLFLSSACAERRVLEFVAPVRPACVVTPASSPPATRTFDLGAADAYRAFAIVEVAADDDVQIVSADISVALKFATVDGLEVSGAAAGQLGLDDVEADADALSLAFEAPYGTGVDSGELVTVDDHRLVLASFDAIPADAAAQLKDLSEKAREIIGIGNIDTDSVAKLGITFGTDDGATLSAVLPVGLCLGCLAPTVEHCEDLDASVVEVQTTCLTGQDVQTHVCRCDNLSEPDPFFGCRG